MEGSRPYGSVLEAISAAYMQNFM